MKFYFNQKNKTSFLALILLTANTACTAPPSQSKPANCQNQLTAFIGMKKEDAIAVLRGKNQVARVVREDEERYMVTQDYNPNRFNLHIDEGKVVSIHCG